MANPKVAVESGQKQFTAKGATDAKENQKDFTAARRSRNQKQRHLATNERE
ncbi:MAG: hypothetical protein LAP21_04005 [Acidobacteriia bacterium]|nr:hypothetical protein [Terriglobia bacterium]